MENTLIEKMLADSAVRRKIVQESHFWFFHTYFAHYVQHETAQFQKEIISLSENDDIPLSVIVAFRGSGKSTMMTLSYPIWAILGRQQKKFIIILSQTQKQAKQHFVNLKNELETNEVLRKDLGPFKDQSNEWGMNALVIPQYDARIIVASCEQSVRGMRHGPHRPDLIICDDVEDLQSNKTREGRDKTVQSMEKN